jgi:hypothetical protein
VITAVGPLARETTGPDSVSDMRRHHPGEALFPQAPVARRLHRPGTAHESQKYPG